MDCRTVTCMMGKSTLLILLLIEDMSVHLDGEMDGMCLESTLPRVVTVEFGREGRSLPYVAQDSIYSACIVSI